MQQVEGVHFEPIIGEGKKEIVATCAVCGQVLAKSEWHGYADYKRQRYKLVQRLPNECGGCGKSFIGDTKNLPKWTKNVIGDFQAKAKNGDFLVWKDGIGYRYRFRKYGAESPREIRYARKKEDAFRACEKDKEWIL